ncbi:hypothetical protein TrLO_g11981 [Triparma laevis f. longispina]|uniref:Thioredoxin domain-containing protein n=1 Tax=Triparma laevis f. longispina TaxID=1714387 RepID=A0A9W7CKI3_9STRA|nr:hypothetical protein TrLO_g11981 [Triparma laevis f. longispina]
MANNKDLLIDLQRSSNSSCCIPPRPPINDEAQKSVPTKSDSDSIHPALLASLILAILGLCAFIAKEAMSEDSFLFHSKKKWDPSMREVPEVPVLTKSALNSAASKGQAIMVKFCSGPRTSDNDLGATACTEEYDRIYGLIAKQVQVHEKRKDAKLFTMDCENDWGICKQLNIMAFPTVMFGNAVVDDMVGIEDMPVLDMVDGWSKVEVPISLKMIDISPAPQFYKSTKAKIGEIADKVLAPYCSLSFRVACSKKENAQLEDFLTWDIK